MMPSRTFIDLRKIKDTAGQYLLQSDVTADAPFRLLGIPVTVTNRIPVARDLAPSVKLLDQTYADLDQQAVVVVARHDAPLNPSAVVRLRGVTCRDLGPAVDGQAATSTRSTSRQDASGRIG